jgi:ribosomal protein L44E
MLALNPQFDQRQNDLVKVSKKNISFQSIKRILSKTEDEKHEIDIKIMRFEQVKKMLRELRLMLEEEQKGGRDNQDSQIQEEETPPVGLKRKSREIFKKYFASRVKKVKETGDRKMVLNARPFDRKQYLIKNIKKFNILNLIYDVKKRKKTKVVEIIFNNLHPKILERLEMRVEEKLDILFRSREYYTNHNWKLSLMNNYYKSLDVRSGCLQLKEKKYLSPKYFISNLIEAEKKIKEKEKGRYWVRVYQPEMFLNLESKTGWNESPRCGKKMTPKRSFDGDGMYNSLIQIEEDPTKPSKGPNQNDLEPEIEESEGQSKEETQIN